MNGESMFEVPDELDLTIFFECEPLEKDSSGCLLCYKVTDKAGIDLYFSFDEIQRSIQVRLVYQGSELVLIYEEFAEKISIENDKTGEYLLCNFISKEVESTARVYVRPLIRVSWGSLEI